MSTTSEDQASEQPEETKQDPECSSDGEIGETNQGEGEAGVEEDEDVSIHPVVAAVNGFLHRVLDIEDAARTFVSKASNSYNENAEHLNDSLKQLQTVLDNDENTDNRLAAIRNLQQALRDIERHNNSSPVATLEKSLFIFLFAAFDKYIGDLVTALFHLKPDLYNTINKEVPLAEVLRFDSMDLLRESILEREIEALRRKSYIDQFKDLKAKFSIELTKFDDWSPFIESAQRRNLFTHCDGVVSEQYLEICDQIQFKFVERPGLGEQLGLDADYFFAACDRIMVVAIMLGQTLWRKLLPDQLRDADSHLGDLIFDFLHMEEWPKSIALSKFAQGLPKVSTEQTQRVISVNYAIALKAIGNAQAAKNVLDKLDWTASTYDFKLAYAVIVDDHAGAKELMLRIGEKGELIHELAYHDWPLFQDFRSTEEFFDGYSEVYGYKYASKLTLIAEDKKAEVEEEDGGDA